MSVMKLCAGACAMKNGSFAFSAALCGVTPQAQNTGTMPGGVGGTGPPNSGFCEIGADLGRIAQVNRRAVVERKPRRHLRRGDRLRTGEPAHGDDHVAANGPAGSVGSAVRSTQRSLWVGTPAFSSAPSMLMPEPIRKVTRSSRHRSTMSVRSSVRMPSR